MRRDATPSSLYDEFIILMGDVMASIQAAARIALCGFVLTIGVSAQADQIYRCQSYGGGLFWSQTHCQQHGALIDRIESVPSGLSPDRQIRVAEQGLRQTARTASRTDAMTRAAQQAQQREARARERQQVRCDKLQAELEQQYSRSRQKLTALQQQRVSERQQRLREKREQAAC